MYRKGDSAETSVVMNKAVNFDYTDKSELSSEELDAEDTYLDERMYMLSTKTNFKDMQWFLNYLKSAAHFAAKNRDAYPTYLCDLGYIPVVYLPTCVPTLGVKLMLILDQKGIPYIKVRGTSFVRKYFNTEIVDAWVHKNDAARVLGCAPEAVRSVDFVKEVFGIG